MFGLLFSKGIATWLCQEDGVVFKVYRWRGPAPELGKITYNSTGGDVILNIGGDRIVINALVGSFTLTKEYEPKLTGAQVRRKNSWLNWQGVNPWTTASSNPLEDLQKAIDAIAEAAKQTEITRQKINDQMTLYGQNLRFSFLDEFKDKFDPKPPDPIPEYDGKMRNDRKIKKARQVEPAYVRLTKKKRR